MSGNKKTDKCATTDVKSTGDSDSGYLSGFIQPEKSGNNVTDTKDTTSDTKGTTTNIQSKSTTTEVDLDSGYLSGTIVVFPGDDDSTDLITEPEEVDPPKCDKSDDKKPGHNDGRLGVCVTKLYAVPETKKVYVEPKMPACRPPVTDLPVDILFEQDDDGDTYVSNLMSLLYCVLFI